MAVFITVSLAVVLALLVARAVRFWRRFRAFRALANRIPGPETAWIMETDEETCQRVESLVEQLPTLMRLWVAPFVCIVDLHHPDSIRQVLKMPKNKFLYGFLRQFIGEGLVISSGHKWVRNRRLFTTAFKCDVLKSYFSAYNDAVKILLGKWSERAKTGQEFSVLNDVGLLALDVILRCACSYESNCQAESDNSYIMAIKQMSEIAFQRAGFLPYHFDFIFNLSPMGWRARRCCNLIRNQSDKIIRDRKAALAAKNDGSGVGLTDSEIRDEVNTFLLGGHDTIATGLTFTFYCLAKHPGHQLKCQREVDRILTGKETLEWKDLSQLKYTTQCIKESLRLYPPIATVYRELTEDTVIDGYTVPKECWLQINHQCLHRNPAVWSRPLEFDPDRFNPTIASGYNPFQYLPFAAGQRNCIGQNFAMNELKTALALILRRPEFRLSVDPSYVMERVRGAVMRPRDGLLMKVTEREL